MGGGSQTTSSSSSSKNTLPSWLTGAYQSTLPQGQGLLSSMTSAESGAPGLTASGLSSIGAVNPQSIGAADSTLSNIMGGGFMGAGANQMGAANPAIAAEASGSLMNPASNPWLSGEFQQGANAVQNQLGSEFGAAGRNVLASAPVQADEMNNLASQLYGGQYNTNLAATQNAQQLASGNYNTGVGQIGSAAATAPGVTSGLYTPGTTQLNAGSTAYQPLSWYSQLLNGLAAPFGQNNSTGTQTIQNNPGGLATFGGIMSGIGAITGGGRSGLMGMI